MTKEAISTILDHICNQARNSVHATFGAIELMRDGFTVSTLAERPPVVGADSSESLLQFIDDVRELISVAPPAPPRWEELDLVLCVSGIIDALNMASRRRGRHMVLESPQSSLVITQDRSNLEDVLTRVLKTAFHLTGTSEIHVRLSVNREGNGAWAVVAARDEDVARRLNQWLNADTSKVVMPDTDDVAEGVAMMVAGRRLRALGGSATLERDAAGHLSVALSLSSRECEADQHAPAACPPDALSVLVVEDCDESFVLSEVALEAERVSRAHDGHDALDKVHRHRFDLVLMDVHMPGMSGYDVIRNIRDWETETGNARTPIVVLSSDDLDTQRRSAAQCGCSGFLRKPLHRSELVSLLDSLKRSRVLA
jgi:CheY-like chemotaxis protein